MTVVDEFIAPACIHRCMGGRLLVLRSTEDVHIIITHSPLALGVSNIK